MAEKPPEEGYISVVDEEPEILELLKWDTPQVQKQPDQAQTHAQTPQQKAKSPEKRSSKPPEIDPFELPEHIFIETYRLTKDLTRILCQELKPLMPDTTKQVECSVESKVLATLKFYATGKMQKSLAGKVDQGISQYLVTSALVQVTEAMNHPTIVKKYIHFPHLREERDIIKTGFFMKYGVPNVIGCIDCTHVPIWIPEDDKKGHFNKSFHSKKVQIICDSDLTILSVDPSPGSQSHDAILSRHPVRNDLDSLNHAHEQCLLVGSHFYSQQPYLMTPIPKIPKKSPVSPEKYYNTVHAQVHSSISETIKHLKSRWKCLQAASNKQFDPPMCSMMIVACCILHNMCNARGLPILSMTTAEERLEAMKQKVANPLTPKKNDENGVRVREELVQRLWSERRLVPENGPKKRAKKDKPVEVQPSPSQVPLQSQPQPVDIIVQGHTDDPIKRPRLTNPPMTYTLMQPAWGHYPPHH